MTEEQDPQESSYEALKTERYLWMTRAFAVVSILSILANILLLVALGSMQPLTRVQPFLLNIQDKNQQVIDISRINLQDFNQDLLEQSYIRQYILARYTVSSDLEETRRHWQRGGTIDVMTASALYNDFEKKELAPTLRLAESEGMTREVRIDKILRDPSNNKRWNVYYTFKTIRQGDQTPVTQEWVTNIEANFLVRRNVTWETRLRNPLGFTVVNYGRKPVSSQNERI